MMKPLSVVIDGGSGGLTTAILFAREAETGLSSMRRPSALAGLPDFPPLFTVFAVFRANSAGRRRRTRRLRSTGWSVFRPVYCVKDRASPRGGNEACATHQVQSSTLRFAIYLLDADLGDDFPVRPPAEAANETYDLGANAFAETPETDLIALNGAHGPDEPRGSGTLMALPLAEWTI